MIVIPGPASQSLGFQIAKILNVAVAPVRFDRFPDGEAYVRILSSLENKHVVVVQSTYPPQDQHMLELLLILDAAKDLGATKTTAVIPYFAYARQDKRFLPREAIGAKTFCKLLESVDTDEVITVEIHDPCILDRIKKAGQNLSAMQLLGKHLKKTYNPDNPLIIAPDDGAIDIAKSMASVFDSDYTFLEKRRDKYTGEIHTEKKEINIAGRDVIIVDDIVCTGGTIANAIKIIKEQGVKKVFVAFTHALFVKNALTRMLSAGGTLLTTDTIPSEVDHISVAPLIANVFKS